MPSRPILFDLDGTLVDSLGDLAEAANHTLRALGRPPHPVDDYRHMVGNGLDMLVRRALGPDHERHLVQAIETFKSYYAQHLTVRTRLYDGIAELLDGLAGRHARLGVCSNKPHAWTLRIVDALLARWTWRAVAGHRPEVPKKPDPAGAFDVARRMGADPAKCLFVGDSDVDMRTARAEGMVAVGAAWGFRGARELREAGAEHLIDHPRQLLDLL